MTLRHPIYLILAALVGLLAACSPAIEDAPDLGTTTVAEGDATAMLERHGFSGLSARELVETMDRDPGARPLPMVASVRYDEVLIADDQGEAVLPLEGEEFYLSMAPYETFTHDCYFHNLGTCQGELSDTTVHVTITTADGDVLLDEEATTAANGFVGFWIPKDVAGTVTVEYDGKTATTPFASDAEGPTCLTTLELT